MANATVVLYLVHEDYAIDRTVVLHSTVLVVVEHVTVGKGKAAASLANTRAFVEISHFQSGHCAWYHDPSSVF